MPAFDKKSGRKLWLSIPSPFAARHANTTLSTGSLSPQDHHPEYLGSLWSDRCRLLYGNFVTGIAANCILAMLMVWSQSSRIDQRILMSWLGAVFVAALVRTVLVNRYQHRTTTGDDRFWIALYLSGAIVSALVWSVGGVYIALTGDIYAIGMSAAVLAGIAAGALALLGSVFLGCAAFLSILAVPFASILMASGQRDETLLGIMVAAFLVFTLAAARRYEQTLLIAFDSRFDDLTKLRNRQGFEELLQRVLKTPDGSQFSHTIAFVDLDRFKIVNDTAGHMAGDALLRDLAKVIQSAIGDAGYVCRIGGDEFALLIPRRSARESQPILTAAKKAIHAHRHRAGNRTFRVTASIGVLTIDNNERPIDMILTAADLAAYTAKNKGGNRIHVSNLDDQLADYHRDEFGLVSDIETAMDDDRFVLVAQYIRPAERNSEHTGADYIELLLRMVGGNQSLLPAAQFVPAAEHFGLMSMLDRWVISKSFAWLNDHRHQLDNLGHCFINLSTQSLGDDEFADFLESQVGTLQLPVTKICFEITEGASIRDMEAATDFVDRFKKLGCKFALDDFGHGFSSFSYLQILPIDIVKIDKSYVINALTDPASAAIVRAINDLSHGLGKISVAEGVESDLHRDFLYNLGVDYVQGHAIHSPEHLDDLVEQFGGDRVLGIPAAIQYGPLVNQH